MKFIKIVTGNEEFKVSCPKSFDYNRMLKNHGNSAGAFYFILGQTSPSRLLDLARFIVKQWNMDDVKVTVLDSEGNEVLPKLNKTCRVNDLGLLFTALGKQTRIREAK